MIFFLFFKNLLVNDVNSGEHKLNVDSLSNIQNNKNDECSNDEKDSLLKIQKLIKWQQEVRK